MCISTGIIIVQFRFSTATFSKEYEERVVYIVYYVKKWMSNRNNYFNYSSNFFIFVSYTYIVKKILKRKEKKKNLLSNLNPDIGGWGLVIRHWSFRNILKCQHRSLYIRISSILISNFKFCIIYLMKYYAAKISLYQSEK